ncbi:hypothetical protein A7K50_01365 [Dehalobacter sp. MCB1]|uniref:hypothetical protein n=1 Tax=unclassified Dehalobacter TaxID=2635733 RepID=UPI000E6C9252|nr:MULTISPECIES: hypothetical protein [unclassified Dehalobacter]RJE47920.1 hypothetical protein A7K50_01365 [Dehalobacter sp. MCB1]TCX56097.1 hypothetical protein C1I38_00845 [Dehalobacter sp. 12DCB1]
MLSGVSRLDYFIKEQENSVELWSNARLPFEPKGWLREMRDSLKISLKSLKGSERSMLYAVYASEQKDFCDVENVLLYNVGSGAFSNLCRNGLSLERSFSAPPVIPGHTEKIPHYHCYQVIDVKQDLEHWKKIQTLAHWEDISFPVIQSNSKPHSFWYAMKKGKVHISNNLRKPNFFGIELMINVPYGTRINLAAVVKPLLDGIISSVHVHDGTNISLLSERLSDLIGTDQSTAENMLMDSATAVLGKINMLHPYRQGVQWSPADDLCMTVKILCKNSSTISNTWRVSGELFEIALI